MYDLVAIGGGSAGLTVGRYGPKLGAKVAIVEADRLGGDCTWTGCVPSKALIASARAAHHARHTADLGLPVAQLDGPIDLAPIVDRILALQEQIYRDVDHPDLLRAAGCDVIEGRARFVGPHTIEVDGRRIDARYFCIATGSSPAIPPIDGLDGVDYLTNHTVFQIRELPPRLLIVGGGPIGLELGQAFARLGSDVVIAEALSRVLTKEEPEVSDLITACLRSEGVEIRTDTRVQSVRRQDGEIRALLSHDDDAQERPFDAILLTSGRTPNVDDLGLDAAGIDYGPNGIKVDGTLRTSNDAVFAVGDVTAGLNFTHVAAYEASLVLRNALFPRPVTADYSAIPWATFTDPEVSHVGLTEAEARSTYGSRVQVYRQDFADIDRARLDGDPRGFCKLITRDGDRILGAHIIGPGAGELIHEYALALQAGLPTSSIADTVHAYPTLSEINRFAALQSQDAWLTGYRVQGARHLKRISDWFQARKT